MLHKLNLENVLFLDIETVPEFRDFSEMDDEKKILWEEKSNINERTNLLQRNFMREPEYGVNLERSSVFLLDILALEMELETSGLPVSKVKRKSF